MFFGTVWGCTAAQLFETPRYKLEGRGFDLLWDLY
jgi:hypothetical protein